MFSQKFSKNIYRNLKVKLTGIEKNFENVFSKTLRFRGVKYHDGTRRTIVTGGANKSSETDRNRRALIGEKNKIRMVNLVSTSYTGVRMVA